MRASWKTAAVGILVAGGLVVGVAGAASKNDDAIFAEFGTSTGDFCTTLCAGPEVTAKAYQSCVQTCADAKNESENSEEEEFIDD